MANTVVNRQVNVYINSGEAAKAYDRLIAREKLLNEELKKTADPKRIKQLNAELDKLKDPIDRAAKKMRGELAPSVRELETATRKFLNEWKKTGDPETLKKFKNFQAELRKAKSEMDDLSKSNSSLTSKGIFTGAFWANLAAGGVTAAAAGISNFFRGAVEEALEADAATRKLEDTLDNLGRGETFDRIIRKADALAKQFRYLDNDDIVGVFNKLIDYGRLTEKEMNNLLPVIIDFAAKSEISIDQSAEVIIKALEGNGRALKEYGINIKDAGSESERLSIIMTTLKEKVDGSGEAFQNSAKGGILTARQELKNLQEEIGSLIIPALNKLLSWVSSALKAVKTLFKDIRDGFKNSFSLRGIARQANERGAEAIREQVFEQVNDVINLVNDAVAAELDKKPLGISSPESKKKTKKDTTAEDKRKKELEAYAAFLKRIKELNDEFDISQLAGFEKDLALLQKKIELLNEEAAKHKNNKELLLQIDELYRKEAIELIDKYAKIDAEKIKKAADAQVAAMYKAYVNLGLALQKLATFQNRDKLAQNELSVLQARGKARLEAELKLLEEQKRQELANKELTENEKLLIEEKYRRLKLSKEREFQGQQILQVIEYAQQVFSIISIMDQARTDKENAELEADRRRNDTKKANLEKRLKAGLITQLQYAREIDRLDHAQMLKEKKIRKEQFERDKRARIVQAVMNGAQAITTIWATTPKYDFGIAQAILMALSIASTAAQVATIASQKAPEFAKGGKLPGRSHAEGGNAVIDGSGRKIAEVEAGEGIVNKKTMAERRQYSVTGTPSQIISRLNGIYGVNWESGARLTPAWRNFSPQRMNYSAMKQVYAAGGQFISQKSTNEGSQNAIFENLSDMISNMQATQASLAAILERGIVADVSIIRFEQQLERLEAIRDDATMRG